jgi:hypothetical protein
VIDFIAFALQQNKPTLTDSITYNFLKDFSLPLLAIIWAVYTYYRQTNRKLFIRQVGDQYSDRIESAPDARTSYSVEVAITNDSAQAAIVIAYYDIEVPWNEPNLDPLMDPRSTDPPKEFYTIHCFNMQVSREDVLNHRRFQNGKLMPGDTFRGYFLAKGDNPIPDDLRRDSNQRWIEAKFVIQDTKGREYRSPIYLHF